MMAVQKIGKIWLGQGDMLTGGYSEISSGLLAPLNTDGNDGDVYIRVSGANSDFLIKKNGIWISLINSPLSVVIPNNTAGFVLLSVASSAARYIQFDYGISRLSARRRGEVKTVNNGTDASILEAGIITVGTGDVGVDLDAAINGANLELRATTDNQGASATMTLTFNGWS